MTINEEIIQAKFEKSVLMEAERLISCFDFSNDSAENKLNIKFSEQSKNLKDFNYNEKLIEMLTSKAYCTIDVMLFRECIESALRDAENEKEDGYRDLAIAQTFLKEASTGIKRAAMDYEGDTQKAINNRNGHALAGIVAKMTPERREVFIAKKKSDKELANKYPDMKDRIKQEHEKEANHAGNIAMRNNAHDISKREDDYFRKLGAVNRKINEE